MCDDCIFCKIASGEISTELVYEGTDVVAFRDINAQAPTHIQIIPRRHVAKIADFDPAADAAWLTEMFAAARALAEREGLGNGFRLVMNNGALAGQSVLHVHLHLLGGRQLGWPPG